MGLGGGKASRLACGKERDKGGQSRRDGEVGRTVALGQGLVAKWSGG